MLGFLLRILGQGFYGNDYSGYRMDRDNDNQIVFDVRFEGLGFFFILYMFDCLVYIRSWLWFFLRFFIFW